MKVWQLAIVVSFGLAAGFMPARQPKAIPEDDVLRKPGETTLFAFVTANGTTASLCEGRRGAYLVYRFGTAAKTELQYPAKLDASSWQKFTYWTYQRTGGAHNAGRETNQLLFRIGAFEYALLDETADVYNQRHEEEERRTVGIWVRGKRKAVFIAGKEDSADWYLQLDASQRKKVKVLGFPLAD